MDKIVKDTSPVKFSLDLVFCIQFVFSTVMSPKDVLFNDESRKISLCMGNTPIYTVLPYSVIVVRKLVVKPEWMRVRPSLKQKSIIDCYNRCSANYQGMCM